MAQVETKTFLSGLNKKNKGYELLEELLVKRRGYSFYIEPKHKNMYATAERLFQQRWPAVVDKRFGMIFGCPEGAHETFRGALFCYHEEELGEEMGVHNGANMYVSRGLGYYMSSMMPGIVIAGTVYRPDRYDKDLFEMYAVRYI